MSGMKALHRKLLRDLIEIRGQAIAIVLVMASGVALFVLSVSTLDSLQRALDAYYEGYSFAEVFVRLKRAPLPLVERFAAIPGVARIEPRIVEQVVLDVPGLLEPAGGLLISIPERGVPALNRLYLRRGRFPEPGRPGEVLASEGFVQANGLWPGDAVLAVLNGRRQKLTIVGIGLSPEHIYLMPPGGILPDDRRFGALWMARREMEAAFDMKGAFNDACMSLMPGASEPEVLRQVDRLAGPYGGIGAHGRGDQTSHQFVINEIRELRGMAVVVPAIFLAVSAFLLNIVFSRMVRTQREQIAVLKAFGYSNRELGAHYLEMVLVLVALGSMLGTAVGAWLGSDLTAMYTGYFRFPVFRYHLGGRVVVAAITTCGLAAVAGTLNALRRAVRLPPAAAMRPESPPTFRPTAIERIGLDRLLAPAARMVLRNLERRPIPALLSCLGIALATAVLILGSFTVDSLDHVMEVQFFVGQREDLTITFVESAARTALHDIARLPGVWGCEPVRAVPARLHAGHRSRRVGIAGLETGGRLRRLVDMSGSVVSLPPEGLVLSRKLADLLAVGVGRTVTVEVLEGRRLVREVPVAGILDDFSGTSAYMEAHAAARLVGESETISGALVAADPGLFPELYAASKGSPRVASVQIKGAALQSFRRTVAENLLRMRVFTVIFAGLIAVGVVYNAARLSLTERTRELATLRVIGYTRGEVSLILLGELALLTLLAIPLGLLFGRGLAALVIDVAYDTELFRIPLIVSRFTYAFAAAVTAVAAAASALAVRRRLDRLDLIAVLKTKE